MHPSLPVRLPEAPAGAGWLAVVPAAPSPACAPRTLLRGALSHPPTEDPRRSVVFEGHSHEELEALLKRNPEFRRLYHHHRELNSKVMDAELGVLPIDDTTLAQMKKEKLLAKDRLTRMVESRSLIH